MTPSLRRHFSAHGISILSPTQAQNLSHVCRLIKQPHKACREGWQIWQAGFRAWGPVTLWIVALAGAEITLRHASV